MRGFAESCCLQPPSPGSCTPLGDPTLTVAAVARAARAAKLCSLQLGRLPTAGVQLAYSRSRQAAHCYCHVLLVSVWSFELSVWMRVLDTVIYQGNWPPLTWSACWTLCTQGVSGGHWS